MTYMPKLILLSIPGLREKDVAVMPQLRELTAGGRDRRPGAQLPLRHLPGAGHHDHRPTARASTAWWATASIGATAARSRCGPRRTIASSGRRFGTCSSSHASARGTPHLGRLVPDAQQGLRGRLRLHAGPDPQSRRLGVALVLHAAGGALRHAARRAGAFPAATLLGPAGQHPLDRLDRRLGRRCAAEQWQPDFFYIYLPHLDYAAQRTGPDSPAAHGPWPSWTTCSGRLAAAMGEAYGAELLVAGGRRICHHAGRSRGLSQPRAARRPACWRSARSADGEQLDLAASRAWALADHQFSHVFVAGGDRSWPPAWPTSSARAGHRRGAGRRPSWPATAWTIRAAARSC